MYFSGKYYFNQTKKQNEKILIIILSLAIYTSCNKEDIAVQLNENLIFVPQSELPNVKSVILGNYSFKLDSSRNASLDTSKGILRVPITTENGNAVYRTEHFSRAKIRICIPISSRRSGCSRLLGFRCGPVNCVNNQISSRSSISRTQPVEVSYNEESNELEYQFINEVNWQYLSNN